jgi:hypothetical protein
LLPDLSKKVNFKKQLSILQKRGKSITSIIKPREETPPARTVLFFWDGFFSSLFRFDDGVFSSPLEEGNGEKPFELLTDTWILEKYDAAL